MMEAQPRKVWDDDAAQQTLLQVAELCKNAVQLELKVASDGTSFLLSPRGGIPEAPGILSVAGRLNDEGAIVVKVELFRSLDEVRVSAPVFCGLLSHLGEKTRLCLPPDGLAVEGSLWAELRVKGTPLSVERASALLAEFTTLTEIAKLMQAGLSAALTDSALTQLYAELRGLLSPIHPWRPQDPAAAEPLLAFGRRVMDYLGAGLSIAVASAFSVQQDAALAVVALAARESSRTLGRLMASSLNARGLLELVRKAPGTVAASAANISLGSNPYELGSEMAALLSALAEGDTPVIFYGRFEELQTVFHGGQGGASDPLRPVLVRAPEFSFDSLARFAAISAGRLHPGSLSQAVLDELTSEALTTLGGLPPSVQNKLLPALVRRAAGIRVSGRKPPPAGSAEFAADASGLAETLAGLSPRSRARRPAQVQELLTRVLTDPALFGYFQEHLLAQDAALRGLVDRLAGEALTRPPYQPIRYCALGTPATGKSESAAMLARRLDVPLINIDAASMSDYHTAAAQLLGSGRGIVGSHQAGRLEQAAKHHTAVVVEVSDIDHAVPSVQSYMADLFLQVLDTGEAQSSIGPKFSCTNLVFAFTMNLPGGMDERIRQGMGFSRTPGRRQITAGVAAEVKSMLSAAFLSRIGTPIVFDPLDGSALALILARAVHAAVFSAAERLGFEIAGVDVAPGAGEAVLARLQSKLVSFGARALLERARDLSAKAVLEWRRSASAARAIRLCVAVDAGGDLVVTST
jgi:hypothetical protein